MRLRPLNISISGELEVPAFSVVINGESSVPDADDAVCCCVEGFDSTAVQFVVLVAPLDSAIPIEAGDDGVLTPTVVVTLSRRNRSPDIPHIAIGADCVQCAFLIFFCEC
ncbi:hypothetical protein AUR64_04135 [Haloprofundus marisrubri]|uniref:Uncharacterized protein n=1 Tax=Haloprofundus marisrubri TaxID=1514971 RepID=A0A0W1RCZ9_9EURY|nr:hypothetical protein AUR64_04135 [Haloprofundus marisrubri]